MCTSLIAIVVDVAVSNYHFPAHVTLLPQQHLHAPAHPAC
eukprot:COSAG02_NODE_28857_length_581_cov_0.531120_1_plen_39_part_10